jgi:hypothetical protein
VERSVIFGYVLHRSRRVPMAAGAEGRANMVFTQVTIGPLGGLRDVVRLSSLLLFIIYAFLACNESVLDQDRGSRGQEVLWSSRADARAQ